MGSAAWRSGPFTAIWIPRFLTRRIKRPLEQLIACPSPPRRDAVFTDVVGGGHLIWDPIYDLSGGYGDIYQWMLTQAKP